MSTSLHSSDRHATTLFEEGACRTPAGAAYNRKVLHPPGPTDPLYAGCPDNNATDSVNFHFQLTDDVSTFRETAQGGGPNDYGTLLLFAPGFLVPVFQANSIQDINLWTCKPAGALGDGHQLGQNNVNFSSEWPLNETEVVRISELTATRQVYRSTTVYLNTNELSNKGTVSGAAFRPNVFTISVGGQGYISSKLSAASGAPDVAGTGFLQRCANWDNFIAKATEHHRTRAAYIAKVNEARTIASKDAPLPPPQPYVVSDTVIQVVVLGKVIRTMAAIGQSSLKSDTWLAREGAYVRQFPSQPVNQYKATEFSASNSQIQNLLYCAYVQFNSQGIPHINYFTNGSSDPNDPKNAIQDLPWSDWTWDYCWMNDMDAASKVTLKTVYGWQAQPVLGSSFCTLMQKAPPADNLALESLSIIANSAPDMLPAKFNDNGPKLSAVQTRNNTDDSTKKTLQGMSNEVKISQGGKGRPIKTRTFYSSKYRKPKPKNGQQKTTSKLSPYAKEFIPGSVRTPVPAHGVVPEPESTAKPNQPTPKRANKRAPISIKRAKKLNNKEGKVLSKLLKKAAIVA